MKKQPLPLTILLLLFAIFVLLPTVLLPTVSLAQDTTSKTYKVETGDTLEEVAEKFDLSIEEIFALSNIKNAKAFTVGRTLNVTLDNLVIIEDAVINPLAPTEDSGLPNAEIETIQTEFQGVVADLESSTSEPDPAASFTGELWPAAYPWPISNIRFSTNEVKPGQSFAMTIELLEAATLQAHFVGQKFSFLEEELNHTTLMAVPLNQDAGIYPLDLAITTAFESTGLENASEASDEGTSANEITQNLILPIVISPRSFETNNLEAATINTTAFNPQINDVESNAIYNSCSMFEAERRWDSTFRLPIESEQTSTFAIRNNYKGSPATSLHTGIDFKANKGAAVFASANGIVRLLEDFPIRGKTLVIDHGLGVCTVYTHLDSVSVELDQEVKKDDRIASVGSSGLVKLVRLHWEIRVMGIPVDPALWTQP